MEPLSIATGCVGLLTGVSKLSVQISSFVSSVRDARKDMDAVSRELSSLALCLETLRDDSMRIHYPNSFRDNLLIVLKNCDTVTTEMAMLLSKLSSANMLRKIQWTVVGRDEMNKLRSSLESHKSALEVGLDMTTLLLISAVKDNVADVKADTVHISSIKQDTSQIEVLIQQIGFLRLQLEINPSSDAKTEHLQRFLDESTTYAETVLDVFDDGDDEEEHHLSTTENSRSLIDAQPAASTYANVIQPALTIPPSSGLQDQSSSETVSIGRNDRPRSPSNTSSMPNPNSLDSIQVPCMDKAAILVVAERRKLVTSSARLKLDERLVSMITGTHPRWQVIMGKKSLSGGQLLQQITTLLNQGAAPNDFSSPRLFHGLDQSGLIEDDKTDVRALLLMRGAYFKPSEAAPWLLRAAERNQHHLVRAFLECGVSPNHELRDHYNSLTAATGTGSLSLVKLLLKSGASITLSTVYQAAYHGQHGILACLLEHGAHPNGRPAGWTSPLIIAVKYGHADSVQVLLAHNASTMSIGNMGPVAVAIEGGYVDIARALLDKDASVNDMANGRSALCHAIHKSNSKAIDLLLDHKARIHKVDIELARKKHLHIDTDWRIESYYHARFI